RFHRLADTETLEQPQHLGTGCAFWYRGDGARIEQRLLERLGRADVGFGRARAHRNAEAYAGDVDCAAGREPGQRSRVLKHFARDDGEIKWAASRNQLDQL